MGRGFGALSSKHPKPSPSVEGLGVRVGGLGLLNPQTHWSTSGLDCHLRSSHPSTKIPTERKPMETLVKTLEMGGLKLRKGCLSLNPDPEALWVEGFGF